MGTIYRELYTKPLPNKAEVFTRKGERWVRWTNRSGRKQTAKMTTGRDGSDRIIVEAGTYSARYRNGSDQLVKVTTGCKTQDAARAVLVELEGRADKVRSGMRSAAEDSVLDHQCTPIAEHIAGYIDYLRNKWGKGGHRRVSPDHVANVQCCLRDVIDGCGFARLRDLNRSAVEKWVDQRAAGGMAARTINTRLAALSAFGSWCEKTSRLVVNPVAKLPKRDEKADRRRTRRALNEDELKRLLKVATLRPVAEYGRQTIRVDAQHKPTDTRSRRTWKRAPLTYVDLNDAATRGSEALRNRPDYLAMLELRGRERALIYKTLVLSGLRKGELAAVTVGHVELDGPIAYLVLDAADDKAGRGAELPLRGDLSDDIRLWLADRLSSLQSRARAEGKPIPARLPADTPLFNVPTGLVRILDLDLVVAGIARLVTDENGETRIDKRDDRGRTIDVHALRHTFGTHLSRAGISPRTAQAAMRHGSLDMTMNTYTDPKLLDVAGAIAALPDLPLGDSDNAERQKATGTDGQNLVRTLVTKADKRCISQAYADKVVSHGDSSRVTVSDYDDKTCAKMTSPDKQRASGFEPPTSSLGSWHSTTELRPRYS